jgi:hypothetical protein
MTDVGFNALCRYGPADHLRELWVEDNEINHIPPQFRRFESLQRFTAFGNPWSREWRATTNDSKNAASALDYAKSLVRIGFGMRYFQGSHKTNDFTLSFAMSPSSSF